MDFRKGDKVSLAGIVKFDSEGVDDLVAVNVNGGLDTVWVNQRDMALVGYEFRVKDRVQFTGSGNVDFTGTIRMIENDHAWIHLDDGGYATRVLSSIDKRLDEEPVRSEAA